MFDDTRSRDMGTVSDLAGAYVAMLETAGERFGAVITRLARPDGLPALVHCTAGKDRTGLVVGVLLSALGVTDDDVAADYARTAEITSWLRTVGVEEASLVTLERALLEPASRARTAF